MVKLCGFRISNYHNKARLVLIEKGLERKEGLEVESGKRLTESQVICEYLEEAYPQKPLLPRDPLQRAKVRELVAHLELQAVEKDLAKGARAFNYAAFVHLPPVSLATKIGYGRDVLEEIEEVKPYLARLGERAAFRQVGEDRKAAQAAAMQKKK